jgi:hypothetical protein
MRLLGNSIEVAFKHRGLFGLPTLLIVGLVFAPPGAQIVKAGASGICQATLDEGLRLSHGLRGEDDPVGFD